MWGACLGLGSCFRVMSWFGGPSGLISASADEESRPREQARLDQGCFRSREFSDKTVSGIRASCTCESASQKLCDCCMRLSSCGMKVLLCGTPGLSGVMEIIWPPASLWATFRLLPVGKVVCSFWNLAGLRAWGALFDLLESYHSRCHGQWGW